MEWEILAPTVMFVVFVLTTGGVLILRPIAKRIGDLLELYASDRREGLQSEVQLPPAQDRIERGRPLA